MSKVAFVSGASRGVGRAIAVGLLRDGYKVVATARSVEPLKVLASEAGVAADNVFQLAVDFSDLSLIEPAIKSLPKQFSKFDILVNNAAEGGAGTLDVSDEKLRSLITVNLEAPFKLLKLLLPMISGVGSHVFNVASRAGKIGFAGWGAYGATKFALVGLSESLYRELAPRGIKVTALCPSWMDTDMAREADSPLAGPDMIQPDDIMKTIRWLLSLSPAACVREVIIECGMDIS